jgi:hypothetical protein
MVTGDASDEASLVKAFKVRSQCGKYSTASLILCHRALRLSLRSATSTGHISTSVAELPRARTSSATR